MLPPSYPLYGYEETAKICARFIRHVFNCPPDSIQPCKSIAQSVCRSTLSLPFLFTVSINRKPPESTNTLLKFIAYAFHRARLPPYVTYHSLFLLPRLKYRYRAASYAFGHRLFLTSYMLPSKVTCNNTLSNKVGFFYTEDCLRDND